MAQQISIHTVLAEFHSQQLYQAAHKCLQLKLQEDPAHLAFAGHIWKHLHALQWYILKTGLLFSLGSCSYWNFNVFSYTTYRVLIFIIYYNTATNAAQKVLVFFKSRYSWSLHTDNHLRASLNCSFLSPVLGDSNSTHRTGAWHLYN